MKQLNGKMHFKLPGLRVDVNKCHLNLNRIFIPRHLKKVRGIMLYPPKKIAF